MKGSRLQVILVTSLGLAVLFVLGSLTAFAVRWGGMIPSITDPKVEACMALNGYDGSKQCYQQTAHQDKCDDCCEQKHDCTLNSCWGLACQETARLVQERCSGDCIIRFGGL